MRKRVLKSSVIIAVIMAILSSCCLDSESFIPVIIDAISISWLIFMYAVNK